MTIITSKQSLLVTGLLSTSFLIQAATATTTISANIVPKTSFFISDSITLNRAAESYEDNERSKLNGVDIKTSSYNSDNSAKIKINSSHNESYDISISPQTELSGKSSTVMEIKTMKTHNGFDSVNNNKDQELVIEAVIKDSETRNKGVYFGTVEINVNYN